MIAEFNKPWEEDYQIKTAAALQSLEVIPCPSLPTTSQSIIARTTLL
jgi:hypothetical protein